MNGASSEKEIDKRLVSFGVRGVILKNDPPGHTGALLVPMPDVSMNYTMQQKRKNSVPGKRPYFSVSSGPIIIEMGISFDLKMPFQFPETIFDFWPRNSVFGPPCPM